MHFFLYFCNRFNARKPHNNMTIKRTIILILILAAGSTATLTAQETDTARRATLEEVSVSGRRTEGVSRLGGAENGQQIGQDELFRAACCNLGESFVANPAVDVNYSDAATGARQIKLLGLSGTYVQMLCESLPMSGGASQPYLLGFVPGAWMKSISVSKGASSVKNGSQSITGQINVEYLKPDDEPSVDINLYGDSHLKIEGNAKANIHINKKLSTELLGHYEHDFMHHDENGDGWIDMPSVDHYNLQNRWKYVSGRYIMHAGVGYLQDRRHGGQVEGNYPNTPTEPGRFAVGIDSRRMEAYMKHAYLLNREHNTNLALTATAYRFDLDGIFGNAARRALGERQWGMSSLLMLEHDFNDDHTISTGLSFSAESADETLGLQGSEGLRHWREYVPGAYAQYTFTPSYRFTAMAGLRFDRSSLNGGYFTPRMHLKWVPADWLTLRGSAGMGHRSVRPLAENHFILSSGRTIDMAPGVVSIAPMTVSEALTFQPTLESAVNAGLSAAFYIPVGDHTVTLNAEYYYTDFQHQLVVDYDSDPAAILLYNLQGQSYSHTAQVDATYEPTDEWSLMAAMRLNRVMCTYGGQLLEKPLQSRYKALLTVGWKPMMGIWQVDVTLALNGGGRMPKAYTLADGTPSWDEEFPAYPQLNIQLTREFRHFSLYIGGENLTNYRQPMSVIDAASPWSATFEPTMIWGPVNGIMGYAGIRMTL